MRVDREWARAFDAWLAGKAPNTQRAYQRAWVDLVEFTGKGPDQILSADLQAWANDLGTRALDPTVLRGLQGKGRRPRGDGHGLSASTISLWLSAVSSFYRFVSTRYMVPSNYVSPDRDPDPGGERPLGDRNPAATIRRPDAASYARADYLDASELERLLGAIPRSSVRGLRDYALILGYVLTGRRNGEWRRLRWGDLRARGERITYTWRGKNTEHARNELPPPLWKAIRAYLEAAGRLGRMGPEDFVFTPLGDSATRLPNVDAGDWDRNRPLSGGATNALLKKYAQRAGLDARRIHVHVLRHSAAMLEEALGASLASISAFLGHANPSTTMRYLEHLRGQPDTTWEGKARLLGIGS